GGLSALVLFLFVGPAVAEESLSLAIGQLSFTGSFIKQAVSVKNNSSGAFRLITVECGFFKQDQLIAATKGGVQNLAAGATGFTEILASANVSADRSQCRIAEAR